MVTQFTRFYNIMDCIFFFWHLIPNGFVEYSISYLIFTILLVSHSVQSDCLCWVFYPTRIIMKLVSQLFENTFYFPFFQSFPTVQHYSKFILETFKNIPIDLFADINFFYFRHNEFLRKCCLHFFKKKVM